MNGKSEYIVQDILGYYSVQAETGTKAWAQHITHSTSLEDVVAFDKKELHDYLTRKGYQTIAATTLSNVYAIR